MMHEIDNDKKTHQSKRRKLLGLLGFTLLAGCDDMFGWGKKKPVINPEHSKEIESDGQKFQVFVVGGIRFVAPISYHVGQAENEGFDMHLAWPDIPPGKYPGTKFVDPPPVGIGNINRTSNQVWVQIRERPEGGRDIDPYTGLEKRGDWASPNYIVRDDLELGLKTFVRKEAPKELIDKGYFDMAYSLNNEVLTPLHRVPVVIEHESINFSYAPTIYVDVTLDSAWNKSNWKGIFLGVVETLNNYREEGKK